MAKLVKINVARPTYKSIVDHHSAVKIALESHFSKANPDHASLTPTELEDLKRSETLYQEKQDVLSLLAFLEACFRVDYISRKKQKLKDNLSRALIKIFNQKHYRASLDDDIFKAWYKVGHTDATLNSHLHEAFHYRHWLAHGQYWESNSFRRRDFYELSSLVEGLINSNTFEA